MRLPVLAVLVAVVCGVTGCSDEPPPYEDGAQGVPLAGLGSELDDAGVDVVEADRPPAATPDQVAAALEDAGLDDVDADTDLDDVGDALAVDGTGTAGLLALAGNTGNAGNTGADGTAGVSAVVLVFTSPEAAAVYAAGDPDVFSDDALEAKRTDLLSGNLAAYAVDDDSGTRVRRALESLGSGS